MPHATPQERFQALLDRHAKLVLKVVHAYCRNAEDRRDLAQEISAQLWRSFASYDEGRPFATWMYRIALNVAITFARRGAVRSQRADSFDEQQFDPIDDRGEARELDARVGALQRFIERLGELERALLLLYLEDNSYADIAEVLGISATNVATKLSRLKQRIRDEIPAQPAD